MGCRGPLDQDPRADSAREEIRIRPKRYAISTVDVRSNGCEAMVRLIRLGRVRSAWARSEYGPSPRNSVFRFCFKKAEMVREFLEVAPKLQKF